MPVRPGFSQRVLSRAFAYFNAGDAADQQRELVQIKQGQVRAHHLPGVCFCNTLSMYVVVAVSHPSDAAAEDSLEWIGDVALEFERAKFDTPSYEILQFARLNGEEWAAFASRFTKFNGAHGVEVFITDTANAGSIAVPAANATDAAAISRFLTLVVSGHVTFTVGCGFAMSQF